MRITVRTREDKTLVFCFPTVLLVNRFSAMLLRRKLKKEGVKLSRRQTDRFLKELKHYRSTHPGWVLVDFRDKKGPLVEVKL